MDIWIKTFFSLKFNSVDVVTLENYIVKKKKKRKLYNKTRVQFTHSCKNLRVNELGLLRS